MPVPLAEAPRVVRFGVFELDVRTGELRKSGVRLNLPDQPLQILIALLERPNEIVTRDELRQRLWPSDTFVDFEHGLNAAVKRLRDVLGDSADTPRFIETVPKRGYRFVAPMSGQAGSSTGSLQPSTAPPEPVGPPPSPISPTAVPRRPRHGWWWIATGTIGAVAAAVLGPQVFRAWLVREAPPSHPPSTHRFAPSKQRRLTLGSGLQKDVTWSPDGRAIAYASDRAGSFDIWVQPVDGGEPVQITDSAAQEDQPDWSPDGRTIVFHSDADGGGLFLIPAAGGPQRRLAAFGGRPKWSPDGSRVLFAVPSTDLFRWQFLPRLYVVGLDGTAPREVLHEFIAGMVGVRAWNWVGDSHHASLLVRTRSEGDGIFTIDLSSSRAGAVKILSPLATDWFDFAWAPDYASLYAEVSDGIVKFGVDPKRGTVTSSERLTANAQHDMNSALGLSADGRRLAYTISSASTRLWVQPFDGASGRIRGVAEAVTDIDVAASFAALSPDGSKLVYTADHTGSEGQELWLIDLTTRTRRELAGDDQLRISPVWSRDGRWLAYNWLRPNGPRGHDNAVAIRQNESREERVITAPTLSSRGWSNYVCDWAPDGRAVLAAFNRPRETSSLGLWSIDAPTLPDRPAKILTSADAPWTLWQARYSPDGRWIAFLANANPDAPGSSIVFVIPSTGATERQWVAMTDRHRWADKPRWSPDGTLLYYTLWSDSFWNVWAIRFDPTRGAPVGQPFRVTHYTSSQRQISPDFAAAEIGVSATRLVLPLTERTGSIWMVDTVDR